MDIAEEIHRLKGEVITSHEEYIEARRRYESTKKELESAEADWQYVSDILEETEDHAHTSTARPGSHSPSQIALTSNEGALITTKDQ